MLTVGVGAAERPPAAAGQRPMTISSTAAGT
jgi:hypothetical protein